MESMTRGTSFLFVGKLATMTREQARMLVKSQGGTCPSGISENLDYLVVGDENSPYYGGEKKPKQLKAEAMIAAGARIAIINERDFLSLVEDHPRAYNI